ncbi:hypothetical protein DP106_14520 [Halonotius pteroides]|uniref:Uncharacterized protein n=2 Tax=Halonotius pteroides TaxID=268735 RepID=A0A3A6PW38_9EURY|nr:hypothetical protein DP106_14490 [Halonotius pteroides]RJX47633.1 hypothetical protein DP106_14520 [Halonotius pteroides]
MDTAAFVRTRFRAGYRLWSAGGDFDVSEMRSRLEDDIDDSTSESQTEPSDPASASKHDRFAEQIKRSLPTNEEDAISPDEVEDLVSTKVIRKVLSELREAGEVEYSVTQDGFIRK